MFNDSKYSKLYFRIIENAKSREILNYGENHHIIPKCMGGLDDSNNIVRLSGREHFLCHWLLTKMSDAQGLKFSFFMMTRKNKLHSRDYRITSKAYEIASRLNAEASSTRSKGKQKHNVGKKRYHDPITQENFYKFETDDLTGLSLGVSDKFKVVMKGKNSGKIYYNNPTTGDVIALNSDDIPPISYIKGNPNAATGKANIGKKCYYNPVTGDMIKAFDKPVGYIEGTGKSWITDGLLNKQINLFTCNIEDGWILGKTHKNKEVLND